MKTKLKQLGLTSYESCIYKTLLEYGKLDAKSISEYSKVPPTAVYPNLKSLEEKQLIQKFKGEISMYEALQPSIAIPAFIEKKRNNLNELKETLIEEAEARLHQKEITPTKEVVQLSIGKKASSAIYQDFFKRANKSVYILGWKLYTIGDKYTLLRNFKELLEKDVDIRLISIGGLDKHKGIINAYKEAGVRIRYTPLDNISIVIIDGKECKITLKSKEHVEKFNIHVNDQYLAKALESYFLTTWENSQDV